MSDFPIVTALPIEGKLIIKKDRYKVMVAMMSDTLLENVPVFDILPLNSKNCQRFGFL